MKILKIVAWAAGIVGAIIMILGVLDFLFQAEIFKVVKAVNYFNTANSFLLLGICCILLYHNFICKEEK
jgi:hypothetical protein